MTFGAIHMGRIDWTPPQPAHRGRVGVELSVDLGAGAVTSAGRTRNISPDGAFIATGQALRVGEIVALRFAFPGYLVPVGVWAEVRWTRPAGEGGGGPIGAGVRFVDPSIAASAAIAALLHARDDR
jgi:uncharacterized protein (TIGR02266 family)